MRIDARSDRDAAILEAVRAIPAGSVGHAATSRQAHRAWRAVLKTVHAPDVPWWRVVRADGTLAAGAEQGAGCAREGTFLFATPIRYASISPSYNVAILASCLLLPSRRRTRTTACCWLRQSC